MGHVWLPLLLGVLFLLAFGAVGLALAKDFRGVTTWHARRTVGMFGQPSEEQVAWLTYSGEVHWLGLHRIRDDRTGRRDRSDCVAARLMAFGMASSGRQPWWL